MASKDDEQRSGLADAAGRAAFFPARAAARAWRGPLEEAVDEVLSAPEIARVLDRALAGSLPEELARSLVRHRVLERIVAELAASGELERLMTAALGQPARRSSSPTECSQATRRNALCATSPRAPSSATRSPCRQPGSPRRWSAAFVLPPRGSTTGPNRSSAAPREPSARSTAGSRRARLALAADAAVTIVLFMSVVGIAALVASLVGGLRPEWLVGALLASGWMLVAGTYFVLFWSSAGQTPGMRLLRVRVHGPAGDPPSIGRSLVRLVGLVLAIVPMFAGFIPVLFTERRRGLPDFLAGTVVVYDD